MVERYMQTSRIPSNDFLRLLLSPKPLLSNIPVPPFVLEWGILVKITSDSKDSLATVPAISQISQRRHFVTMLMWIQRAVECSLKDTLKEGTTKAAREYDRAGTV